MSIPDERTTQTLSGRRLLHRKESLRRRRDGNAPRCDTRTAPADAPAGGMLEQAASRRDGQGGAIKLSVHNELGDDILQRLRPLPAHRGHHGTAAGRRGLPLPPQDDLEGAATGGAWEWHQDYGYWYNNGCLFPDLASCLIAVDRATRRNGCLQVLKGSHHLGRIDHGKIGDQTGPTWNGSRRPGTPGTGPLRARSRLGHLLPLQPAASLGPEPQRRPALGPDLLLQRRAQQSVQGVAPPALFPPGEMPDERIKEIGKRDLEAANT